MLLAAAYVDLRQVTSSLLRGTFQPFNTPLRRNRRESPGLGSTTVDALALAGVIVAGIGTASTGINAFYNTRRTAKTAQEGPAEQRAADGYLKVLSLAERGSV